MIDRAQPSWWNGQPVSGGVYTLMVGYESNFPHLFQILGVWGQNLACLANCRMPFELPQKDHFYIWFSTPAPTPSCENEEGAWMKGTSINRAIKSELLTWLEWQKCTKAKSIRGYSYSKMSGNNWRNKFVFSLRQKSVRHHQEASCSRGRKSEGNVGRNRVGW